MLHAFDNEDIGMIKLLAGTTNWLKAITNKTMKNKDTTLIGPEKDEKVLEWTNKWIESRICDSTISNKSRLPQFVWAIKLGKNTVARTILGMMDENIIYSALIGALYHRNKLSQFNDRHWLMDDIEKSTTEAQYYENLASEIFKSAYEKDKERAKELLICGNKAFSDKNILELAYESKSKHFMALDGVQQKLGNIWYNSSNEPVMIRERAPMSTRIKSYWIEFKALFTFMAFISPRHIRAYHILSYIAFIFMFMYIIVFDFCNNISGLQWFHCVWMLTMIGDGIFQVVTEKWEWLNMYNLLDSCSYLIYVVAFIIRLIDTAETNNEECLFTFEKDSLIYAAHVLYCLAFFTMVIRSLSFFRPAKEVLIIWSMMKQMIDFMKFYILFAFAYGVASFALLYPNSLKSNSWDTYFEIGHVPFYVMFGDTADGERTQWSHADAMEPNLPGGHCYITENLTQSLVIGNATYEEEQRCPNTSRWVMLLHAGYMMVGNLLLVNLLIAKFSSTYEKIESEAVSIQKFERYDRVHEYYYSARLPPPFVLFEWLKWFITYQMRNCSLSSTGNDQRASTISFRRFWVDDDYELKWSLVKYREHHFHSKPTADRCSELVDLELRAARQLLKKTNEKSQKWSAIVSTNNATKTLCLTADETLDAYSQQYISYIDSRSLVYPEDELIRFLVLPSAADWTTKYDAYKPTVISNQDDDDDEDLNGIRFNQYDAIDGYDRQSYDGLNVVKFDIDNVSKRPLNPIGRVGVSGRGHLSYWGPNHGILCVVTRSVEGNLQCLTANENQMLFVSPSKGDFDLIDDGTVIVKPSIINEELAIPGFDNENFWTYGKQEIVLRKIPDSMYNADNAWEVITTIHFHDVSRKLPNSFDAEKYGDDDDSENRLLKWMNVNRHTITDKIVVEALDQVVKKHDANERHQMSYMIEHLATELKDVKSNHSTVELIADKMEIIEAQRLIMGNIEDKLDTLTTGQVTSQQSITEQIKSQQSMMQEVTNKIKKVESQHTIVEQISNDLKLQQMATKKMTDKLEKVESQKTIIEQMSNELKSQHAMVRQLADELTQIKLQQSTHMTNERNGIKKIEDEMAKMTSQNSAPSIDHNGDELEIAATYRLLLDFDGMKYGDNYLTVKKGDEVKVKEKNSTNFLVKVSKMPNNETGLVPANLIAKMK